MKKLPTFQVMVDGMPYTVEFCSKRKEGYISVNGNKIMLDSIQGTVKKGAGYFMEYPFMIGSAQALISVNRLDTKHGVDLVINGTSVSTNTPYIPFDKVPAYIYVFTVIDLLWILGGGALPVMIALLAAGGTFSLAGKRNYSTTKKVLISILYFVLETILILGVSLAVSSAIYS